MADTTDTAGLICCCNGPFLDPKRPMETMQCCGNYVKGLGIVRSNAMTETADRRIAYARELDQLAADRRAEASRLRAIIRATEAEADRIEAKAHGIMQEITNG